MSEQPTHEALRELGKRLRAQLPDGLFYCVLVWPPLEPEDVTYFSNAHRLEALHAMKSLLGELRKPDDP